MDNNTQFNLDELLAIEYFTALPPANCEGVSLNR